MKVISLINMKGGVGKTTLAVNIADCLTRQHGASVLMLDVDPQFNATQCLMSPDDYVAHRAAGRDTMLDLFDRKRVKASTVRGSAEVQPKTLQEIEVVEVRDNLFLLPGSLDLYRLEMAPGEGRENRLKAYLAAIQDVIDYDYIIIDTPPTPSVWMTSALIASDYYLIPVRPDPLSLTGLDLLKSIVEDRKENYGLTVRCAGVVLTMTRQGTNVLQDAKAYLSGDRYWRDKIFTSEIPGRVRFAQQQLNNIFMLDSDAPDMRDSIVRLTNELVVRAS
ncbi:AAA family ATPase [Pseudomonas aeruginosa]|uniref:ParA family protein n=1 Tax=Pseudomonas aeruginosa TaxID=287 RepID=UPI0021A97730|nr:AAA family ATPase [Pseudomonas aeruginosa]MCT2416083.1 AAA family ATPase [Pseudomonas aeruginosa]HCF2593177.1 AAA family ATPase [Pseudomonas aeruginosa]